MRDMTSSKTCCRGITLVELLVVMGIMSGVILSITSLFVPMQRSTVVQTRLTDVQSHLRLAMNTLSRDLLNAGFLVADEPIASEIADDFTIRTRVIGSGFGRILGAADAGSNIVVTLSSPSMLASFPVGTSVRLFSPVAMRECGAAYNEADAALAAAHVYTVTSINGGASTVTINTGGTIGAAVVLDETVMVAVRDANQPPVQTIRYQFADSNGDGTKDALLRIVNGQSHFLAMNVSNVNFAYDYTPHGKVQRIDVSLEGQTRALVPGDTMHGAKTRALQSSVTLRNVF
ncbi:MAG: hypothetical protein FIB02_12535 [Desulfuromonas sp.]|nr:hypothetical protein [Desulfuromonas sp.]